MTKTIEKAAKSIAMDFIMEHKSRINNDAPLTHECVQYAVERVMSLPLVSRLTAEEKERVRKEYWQAARDWIGVGDARGYCKTCIALESIFGSDFFKEGE